MTIANPVIAIWTLIIGFLIFGTLMAILDFHRNELWEYFCEHPITILGGGDTFIILMIITIEHRSVFMQWLRLRGEFVLSTIAISATLGLVGTLIGLIRQSVYDPATSTASPINTRCSQEGATK